MINSLMSPAAKGYCRRQQRVKIFLDQEMNFKKSRKKKCRNIFLKKDAILSPVLTFFIMVGYWGLNEICAELENPFGEDANDLPILLMHKVKNILAPKSGVLG